MMSDYVCIARNRHKNRQSRAEESQRPKVCTDQRSEDREGAVSWAVRGGGVYCHHMFNTRGRTVPHCESHLILNLRATRERGSRFRSTQSLRT